MTDKEFKEWLKLRNDENRKYGYLGDNLKNDNYSLPKIVTDAVEEILKDSPYIHTAQLNSDNKEQQTKPKRGPKPMEVNNPFYDQFVCLDYEELESWVDDVLYGVCRQFSGNTKLNPKFLFHFLRCMDSFSKERIQNHMNRKRCTLGQESVSDRYAFEVFAGLRNAIDALSLQVERGRHLYTAQLNELKFNYKDDTESYEQYGKDWYSHGMYI